MGARVRAIIALRQMLEIQMGIDLRGGKTLMAEQLLDRPQVAAGFKQMGGEGVAQQVGMDMLGQALRDGALGQDALHAARTEPCTAMIDEDRALSEQAAMLGWLRT